MSKQSKTKVIMPRKDWAIRPHTFAQAMGMKKIFKERSGESIDTRDYPEFSMLVAYYVFQDKVSETFDEALEVARAQAEVHEFEEVEA